MMLETNINWLVFAILMMSCMREFYAQNADFTGSPGTVKIDSQQSVSLRWNISKLFDTSNDFTYFGIHKGFYSVDTSNRILRYAVGEPTPCRNYGDSSLSCITEGHRVGFNISAVRDSDAGRYKINLQVDIFSGDPDVRDNNAIIYIFKPPTVPVISGNGPVVAGNTLVLQCTASSQSLPISERLSAVMEYTWTSAANLSATSGSQVTVGPLQKQHNGVNVTCTAAEQGSSLSRASSITLNVRYGPIHINFGPDPPTAVVIENTAVSRTCQASCNPACNNDNIRWTNSTSGPVVASGAVFALNPAIRYNQGTYVCTSNNGIWSNTTAFSLSVNYISEIGFTIHNEVSLVQGDSTTLTCTVDSRPGSDIILRNMTDNSVLSADITGNVAVYSIPSIDCLHIGEYKCTASNGVPSADHSVDTTRSMDVKCPPRVSHPDPQTFYKGVAIGENYTFEIHLISNPDPIITRDSWIFTQTNLTHANHLPTNAAIGRGQTTDRLAMVSQLHFNEVTLTNYGNYTLSASNNHGASGPIKLVLTPQGPPSAPSPPCLVHRTAVSLTVSWTAGFNGGYQQTFTVLYTAQSSGDEQSAEVETDPDVNRGDVIVHKLLDPDTIISSTLYTIRIKSENQYQGGSVVYGESANCETEAKPALVSDPQYAFNSTHLKISLTIQPVESVTHLITRVCTATGNCNQENTTVTSPDVFVTVELPVAEKSYTITTTMYDGEDVVNEIEASQKVITGTNVAAIAGGVVGGVLVAATVIVVIIILWRKGIICSNGNAKTGEERKESEHQYANMNVLVMAGDQDSIGPGVESALYEGIADTTIRDVNIQTYQGMNQLSSSADKNVYAGLASSAVNVISSTCIKVVGVFSENAVYKVSSAKPLKQFQKSLPKNLAAKKIQDAAKYPSHHAYLEGAAEAMVKLVNCDNTINCLGLACVKTELLLEHAPFGTLRQYFTGVTEGTYANSLENQFHDQMNFIHQACNGASAVAELKPQCLFHSLSADNALLVANKTIKLTGFATASHVKARETEESEKKLPRPVRWLAPEAIDLKHCTQSDVWGFGILMWEILSLGKTPFEEIEDNSIRTHIGKGHNLIKPDICSDEMYDLMRPCWQMKAENRPSLADIKSDLQATTIYQNI